MRSRKTSIAVIVIVAMVTVTTLVLGTLGVINYRNTKSLEMENLRIALALDADQIAPSLDLPVWNFDHSEIDKVVESMMLDPILEGMVVKSSDNKTVISARERDAWGKIQVVKDEIPAAGILVEKRDITFAKETVATVTLFGTARSVDVKMKKILVWTIFNILTLDLILIFFLYLLLNRWVFKPLREVEAYASTVSAGGSAVLTRAFRGELESLRSSIEKMFRLLDLRYQELQESEERFSKAFQSSPTPITITDMETGRYIEVNESSSRLWGYSKQEMIGHSALELGIWRSKEDRERMLQPLLATGTLRNLETYGLTRDGSTRTVIMNAKLVELGGKRCIVSLIQDITERKRAVEVLQEKQTQLLLAMDIARLAHWEFDVEKNLVTGDEKIFQMFGTTSAQEGGLSMSPEEYIRKFVHPSDAALVANEVALGVATTDPNFARQFEHRIVRADGTEGVMMTRSRILQSAVGKTLKIFGTSQDITEQKRAQAELIWKTAFLEAQVDSALDGILVVDDRAKRILQNQRLIELFNIPDDIARDDDDAKLVRHVTNQVKDPQQFVERVDYLHAHPAEAGRDEIELADGRILDRYSAPVIDKAGKYYGRIWTFRDISKQRTLEDQFRQSQKMEAVGQLASGVAHDFNNILGIIQMQSDLLKADGNLSPAQLGFASEIGEAAQRAAALTRQLLLFSRKEKMQTRELDLNQSINDMTKMLRRTLGENIKMQFKFAMQPLFIHADAGMMDQVLMNLSVNARDAMPEGGNIVIETSAMELDDLSAALFPQSRPGSFVCLSVGDTGCGIPAKNLQRIFEPFFTTKDVGKGTGLGLATVFGIVQQHQGWVNVYSEVGHGTIFRIYLPRSARISDQKFVSPLTEQVQGGNEMILLVEDEPRLRASVTNVLSRLGYNVLEASDGASALEVWKKHRNQVHFARKVWNQDRDEIRLLLTDMVMPGGITGKDLGERLLKENPKLKVIYVSGYSAEVAGKDFPLQEGVNFLTKPFQAQKLAQTIRNSLDKI